MNRLTTALTLSLAALAATASPVRAQADVPGKVDLAFNRYYTHAELNQAVRDIAKAYPDLVEVVNIGESLEGREMLVAIVNPKSGPSHDEKPAMWIDGNVHGNEIQASEVVLYTLWYLTKHYGHTDEITRILDEKAFYLLVSQNPDGRDRWFEHPQTSSSSRSNTRPFDNDNDGLVDEDGPDDLDGDGSITSMWARDDEGPFRRSLDDPRVFERVEPGEKGQWRWVGSEGIDNDGDGRINEDPVGGDDMNRNWPSDWQPTHIQYGAGPFPFSAPETRAVGEFILAHPNIAGGQSYHNTGGMLLRGPGASYLTDLYPREDQRMYDELGELGAQMLPYYRYMIIYKDLYTVHGGFVNWLAEGLGISAFTNELWTSGKMFQRDVNRPSDEQDWIWRDKLMFGQTFKDYTEHDHPTYGKVLIGGPNKWSSRNTPTFMLEEECHRNFAFTAYHADQMPVLRWGRTSVESIPGAGNNLWAVTAEVRNDRIIPTRLAIARDKNIGQPDLFEVSGRGVEVVAAGRMSDWLSRSMDEVRFEPSRVRIDSGVGGRDGVVVRFIVSGPAGARVNLSYTAEKALDLEKTIELRATDNE
ncbi:MAG: M14 family metallopeptidase [Phycisphaerales bacterium]